jgi:hypothetical protein
MAHWHVGESTESYHPKVEIRRCLCARVLGSLCSEIATTTRGTAIGYKEHSFTCLESSHKLVERVLLSFMSSWADRIVYRSLLPKALLSMPCLAKLLVMIEC